MLTIQEIAAVENYFPQMFTGCIKTEDYVLYYNEKNKESWDSNHAIIFKYDERYEEHVDIIASIYTNLGIVPRFYNAYVKDYITAVREMLIRKGYTFELNENRFFYRSGRRVIKDLPELKIKQITQSCDAIDEILVDAPWMKVVIENSLPSDSFRLFIGYDYLKPVTMASLRTINDLTRLDDVKTPLAYRGRKYCQSLLNVILNDESISHYTKQYLYACERDAVHIYEKLGYVEHPEKVHFWMAWKE
ncbi:MAG: hypothetical protein JNL74_02180 [Fibrobacteres bacterium]|nr:hypothetical protein [Fibrobacterota bacterium]